MLNISLMIRAALLSMLMLMASQIAMARELLTEDQLRQVAENMATNNQYGQPINYLQHTAEQDKDNKLQRHPIVFTGRQSALLNGQTTPAIVAEENYRDRLLSGALLY